jgi:hypothetical protein
MIMTWKTNLSASRCLAENPVAPSDRKWTYFYRYVDLKNGSKHHKNNNKNLLKCHKNVKEIEC